MLLALFLVAQTAAAAPPVTKTAPVCQDARPRAVVGKRGAKPHTLAAEPPARQIYTVLREEGGCTRPVPVNDRVIGNPPR